MFIKSAFAGDVYIFINRRHKLLKALYWDVFETLIVSSRIKTLIYTE